MLQALAPPLFLQERGQSKALRFLRPDFSSPSRLAEKAEAQGWDQLRICLTARKSLCHRKHCIAHN